MASELDVGPSEKKSRSAFDKSCCIFCSKPFKTTPSVTPDIAKLNSLFNSCRERLDGVAKELLDNEHDILTGTVSFRYHRNCRATYCSSTHVKRAVEKRKASDASGGGIVSGGGSTLNFSDNDNVHITRALTGGTVFDWKSNCFICGDKCNPKRRGDWSMVEASISEPQRQNLYSKVLQAAEERNDILMLARLRGVANGDLVATEARYHRKRNCVSSYINSRNIAAGQRTNTDAEYDVHAQAIQQLIEEFRPKIEAKQVFLLSTFRQFYRQLLHDACDHSAYTSQKLKTKLQKEWPTLAFIPQKGDTDLVCTEEISVGEVLVKAKELKDHLDSAADDLLEVGTDEDAETSTFNEEAIVHHAVGILRKRMASTRQLDGEYFSPEETKQLGQKEFLDPLVYKAIGWIMSRNAYENGDDIEINTQCLSIACDLTTLSTSIYSPKHLGLAISLYHKFGSRQLIDILSHQGYCISYTELRRFNTSAALHVDAQQQPSDINTFIPLELAPVDDGGQLILAAADNWDHNERTIDGKSTTHAMTSILIQPKDSKARVSGRIKRETSRTLDISSTHGGDLTKTVPYHKPTTRPQPNLWSPITVDEVKPLHNNEEVRTSQMIELLYDVARSGVCHAAEGYILPWSAFHATLTTPHGSDIPVSQVAYNPIIMAPASDLSTVYTMMLRLKAAADALGQKHLPLCFDMGLLSKALEITWSNPTEFEGVILMEGGMHFLMSVIAGIGHLYGDAGLSNLLHESGVFAARTVDHMLAGKDFDRALYGLKLAEEVLCCQLLQQFMKWCEDGGQLLSPSISRLLTKLETSFKNNSNSSDVVEQLCGIMTTDLLPHLEVFRNEGRQKSPTFKLWDDILFKVLRPFKSFISGTRDGLWYVQQSAKCELFPLLFASSRTNYARYMSVQLLAMRRLPQEVEDQFVKGRFAIKLSPGDFKGVWLDYTLETTENKDLKGAGGIIGLTMRGPALVRWFMARPVTAAYTVAFESNTQSKGGHSVSSMPKAAHTRWNADAKKMQDMFAGRFIDPFNLQVATPNLVNIATGAIAPDAVRESLCSALEKGESMADTFVTQRLASETPKSLFDPIPRSNIKTMKEMHKKVKIKAKDVSMTGEIMFLRLLAVNSIKRVPLKRVFAFENAPVPLSLFSEDGMMTVCTKSDFMHKLEETVTKEITSQLEVNVDAIIFDGHAVIQALPPPSTPLQTTFSDVAKGFMSYIIGASKNVSTSVVSQVHIAFDRYLEGSIKSQTRAARSVGKSSRTYKVRGEAKVPPDWKQFLSVAENKSNLAEYYTDFLMEHGGDALRDQQLFLSGGKKEKGIVISTTSVLDCPALKSEQEEADTRIILHAVIAADAGAQVIVVCSPDTDVLVLLLHHRPFIKASEVYFMTGRQGKYTKLTRFIPIHTIFDRLSTSQIGLMLPVYAVTGCDTVSAFFGHGKKTAFKLMTKSGEAFSHMSTIGVTLPVSRDEQTAATRFVCSLYGNTKCENLNDLRCQRAGKGISAKKLPPTEDSFKLHLLRCAYQVYIWKHAHVGDVHLPPPTDYGYEIDDGAQMRPKMMSQEAAAPELLNDIVCDCAGNTCLTNCSCNNHNQPCTTACSCEAILDDSDAFCRNVLTNMAYDDDYDHDDVEEDDSDQ